MGNILEYLDWRGDLSFEADPFNEVDNLILTALAYTEFDGIVPGPEEDSAIGIQEANDRFWSVHTREEVEKATTFYKDAPFLLEKMAASERFKNLQMKNYVNRIDVGQDEQMSAITFIPDDGTVYVAYRGTDDTLIGWKEDFNFSYYTKGTVGQRDAVRYLNEIQKADDRKLRVGGHSKGGNFAIYASAFCEESVRNRILQVYSNDGPGFSEAFTQSPEILRISDRVVKYTPEFSMVGTLLFNTVTPRVVRSSETGVMQHDAFSWQVIGNHFLLADGTSRASDIFDQTMRTWISGESQENRKLFIDTFFGLFDAAGVTTLSEVNANKLQVAAEMMKALRAMPEDARASFNQTSQNLRISLDQTVRAELTEELEKLGGRWQESTKTWEKLGDK
ncbi:MAG: DUF2974 domain-containing protein, partial [Lachnospiraceae bacterium]|nr:DUF2974 domain-containing protein [Lachnospiraceae bacterium]